MTGSAVACSNRTFMELKCRIVLIIRIADGGSNRTFMELKCRIVLIIRIADGGSNRTFMELKFTRLHADKQGAVF